MSLSISRIVQALEPSATIAMATKAKELKARGETVYDLSLGEPDFDTPLHIRQAALEAMEAGHTHYTQSGGLPELRKAIVEAYQATHGLVYAPTQVVVSNGAKHSLHNVFTVLLNPGDEVIIPAPYWVSYAELVKLTGAVPVIVQTRQEDDFRLTPEALRAAITAKTKVLLLCSPSNPTGTMYSPDDLGALADVVLEKKLTVVADEIYERLVYGGSRFASFPTVRPGLQDRCVVVNGVSKTYAMTGWRIGWAMAPANVAKAMDDLQSQETSCPCSVSQYASLAALKGPQECVAEMLSAFAKRRDFVQQRISDIPGLSCANMTGAFYAFINISEHLGRKYGNRQIDTSTEWCLELLAQQKVGMVMGSAFGTEGYARASFATSMANLEAAFDRIEAFVK
ncbi:MAG: pyridoxal phosphate-dependent aminotransferase [Planctomycetaceae bacterium]|nr:pyridoxal phosphate-dependent aminotransferase [Planctomycetaceae bacterium]